MTTTILMICGDRSWMTVVVMMAVVAMVVVVMLRADENEEKKMLTEKNRGRETEFIVNLEN